MYKGGGYVGASTRQEPPTVQTHERNKLVWVRGVCAVAPRGDAVWLNP
jgi:hypothetical protein